MVLTNNQTTAFFENNSQMAIPHATVVQLVEEGIDTVEDLQEFYSDALKHVDNNLCRPAGRIPDPNNANATIPQPSFQFGAKSQMRLESACDLVRFYVTIGRDLTAANICWNPIIKDFKLQWAALVKREGEEDPEVPKISKGLPVLKWTEAFTDFLHRVVGPRTIPLAYVIRETVDVDPTCPPLDNGKPHSLEHGSIEADLVARASHDHALFCDDNSKVYHYLEEATCGTQYAPSIKPFQRKKDGRSAWMAILQILSVCRPYIIYITITLTQD